MSRRAFAAAPAAFLAIFFAWPVATLIQRGFADDSGALGRLLGSGSFRSVAWFTLWQAMASTALTMALAMPLTWAVANVRFRGRRLVHALVTVPFVLPTVVVAGALLATGDRLGLTEGTFALSKSVFAILVAHIFFNVAVVVRTVGGYWSQLSRVDENAARVLGTSPIAVFVRITLRRLRPALLAAGSIVFLFTFTSFGIVLILGGARHRTIETEIFRHAVSRTDFGTAAALSVVQLVAVVVLVTVNIRLRRSLPKSDRITIDRAIRPRSRAARAGVAAIVLGTVTVLAVPIAALIEQSLAAESGWTLDHYRSLDKRPPFLTVTPLRAIANSLGFAVVAATIATVVGGWTSLVIVYGSKITSRLLELGYLLPLGTSAVTLGFGILITFDTGVADLRQSWLIVPLAQALIGIPFVTRAVVPVLRSIDPHLRDAAASMGANPAKVRRDIDAPIARRALSVGAGFAFAISLGEFGATSFVGRRPDLMTVPLAIARLLGQPGDVIRAQAMALSVLLMLLTTVVLLIIGRRGDHALI
ncbi:MAG: ABC transporter permease [Acidimicrobiales bacterium]